ncbi:MAG: HD domain-containing protein [Actinobacteria bacterium]|nr:HD domain-containing protein [Actinomycetota bacterium]
MGHTPIVAAGTPAWRAIQEPEWRAVLAATAALASSENEDQLLADVCDAAVEAGGYLLAWYGRVHHNGEFRLHSIAASGPAVEYLDEFRVAWALDVAPGSPAGLAVATTAPVFTTDTLTDPLFAAWRAHSVQFAVRSLVSFPVLVNGEVDGVFTIYADAPDVFDETAVATLANLGDQIGVGLGRVRASARVNDALESTIRLLTRALEARDPYTAGHQAGVSALAEQIARHLDLNDFEVQEVRMAGLVHDVGKIGIPTELLTKPGVLRAAETALIQDHAAIGEEVLSTINFPWPLATIVGQHHERLDGSGYPRGLKGDEILLAARIIAVADVAEAMGRARPYRNRLDEQTTVEHLQANKYTLFDANVVDACVAVLADASFRL